MNSIINNIRKELRGSSDEHTRSTGKRFFKEEVKMYGVKNADATRITKQYDKKILVMEKKEVFALCEDLWRSGYMEESFIACHWAYIIHDKYGPDDFKVFGRWVNEYVSNWASCDTLCNHAVGSLIEMYPEHLKDLEEWTKSANRWTRRAAAVSLIIPAKQGKFLEEIFRIADALLFDKEDLVQKGYGWMLKAASQAHQDEVFEYVMNNRDKMPRTALRYAIEKMPAPLRERAMVRD
ncbi:MAG: DNA alkylation repair protein [Candidatus Pacebacteria bacterium]|nr:DNA alkylation repair protein [Candidatus Paceibacterota bacterium]